MKLGVDLSIQDELNEFNPKYLYKGKEVEPFNFFSKHSNIKIVRLRLWHHPFDDKGNPYGGGTNDIKTDLRLARKAKEEGMSILLDFHYSDFWVDPSRQNCPKAWMGKPFNEVVELLYQYTKDVLMMFKVENIDIVAVQVGNEITNGMVYPYGELSKEHNQVNGGGWEGFSKLFNAGYKGVKEVYPEAKVVCHLEHSGSNGMQDWYFTNMEKYHVNYDVIGESYYPFWHGGFLDFEDNITKIKAKFNKPVWVVELGYEYAKSRVEGHHDGVDTSTEDFRVGNLNGRSPFPSSKEGQKEYLEYFLALANRIGVDMVYYWEPAWVLKEGNAWAKDAGQIYCGLVPGPASNDWANETLFDFDGNANPAVEVFTQQYVDTLK